MVCCQFTQTCLLKSAESVTILCQLTKVRRFLYHSVQICASCQCPVSPHFICRAHAQAIACTFSFWEVQENVMVVPYSTMFLRKCAFTVSRGQLYLLYVISLYIFVLAFFFQTKNKQICTFAASRFSYKGP